uniref:Uncharacterized protein n=1 Tax=Anopheles minimus TaxID=112268 RepID=A0A182WKL9_9DIPT
MLQMFGSTVDAIKDVPLSASSSSLQYPIMMPVRQSPIKFGIKMAAPEMVTIVPNSTKPAAGSFSWLNKE